MGRSTLQREAKLVDKIIALRDGMQPSSAGGDAPPPLGAAQLHALIKLTDSQLSPRHWAAAVLRTVAHDVLTSLGDATELPSAARMLREHVECWRAHMAGMPTWRAARRLERAGDVFAACGKWADAAQSYVEARDELARLGVQPAEEAGAKAAGGLAEAIEAKLRTALGGRQAPVDVSG